VVVMAGGASIATGERLDVAGLDLTVWATLDGGRAVRRASSGDLVHVEARWLVSIEAARWDPGAGVPAVTLACAGIRFLDTCSAGPGQPDLV
jgi:hypothetical protein